MLDFWDDVRIYNIRTDKNIPYNAVNCMRPSKFGNPFIAKSEADRDAVCDAFDAHVESNEVFKQLIKAELKGKSLICCCWPKRCHCLTLLRVANE